MGLFKNQNQNPSAPQYDDIFGEIAGASEINQTLFPVAGSYPLLYVTSVQLKKSRDGGDLFVADFDIVESKVPERPAGTAMTWMTKKNRIPEYFLAEVKAFIAAVGNVPANEVDAASVKYICSQDNPARGRQVRLDATIRNTEKKRPSGEPYITCRWSGISF